jgi:uncharacterized membrane protein YbhN (UPF0104 family)
MQPKVNGMVWNALRLTLALGSLLYLSYKLRADFPRWFSEDGIAWNFAYIIPALAFMPLNWLLEGLKWRFIGRRLGAGRGVSLVQPLLAGISVSIFTPNRVGEIAGRLLVLPVSLRWPMGLASVLGSYAQLMVTLIAGCLAAAFLGTEVLHMQSLFSILAFTASAALIIAYLGSAFLIRFSFSGLFKKRLKNWRKMLHQTGPRLLLQAAGWSFLRYAVFVLQFWWLLKAMGHPVGILTGSGLIALSFLTSTLVPKFAFSEIGARGSAAVFFLSFAADMPTEILAASSLLWFLNVGTPALIGVIPLIIFNVRQKK